MTDEAMTVAADAAPMPIDTGAQQADAPAVVSEQPTPKAEPTPTARNAIERAFATMNKKEGDGPAVEQAAGDRARNPDGTFKAAEKAPDAAPVAKQAPEAQKQPTAFGDAPTRFSADAKAAWATAPDAIKAEATRAIRELEGGIEQYRQAYEPFKDFDKQLKANGQTFQEVVAHYTGMEQMLRESPIRGLDQICRNLGTSLEAVARHVMGQPADQQTEQRDAYISKLEEKIGHLEKQVGGVTTTIKSQQEKALLDTVEAFWNDPAHSRAEELAEDIVFFFNSGKTKDLKEAYQLAERLNPAPAPVAPSPAAILAATQQTETSQTRKGHLSPSGAPAPGSDPATRKAPASAREALQRSFGTVGL